MVVNHFEPQDVGMNDIILEVVSFMRIDYYLDTTGEIYDRELKNPETKMINFIKFCERTITL